MSQRNSVAKQARCLQLATCNHALVRSPSACPFASFEIEGIRGRHAAGSTTSTTSNSPICELQQLVHVFSPMKSSDHHPATMATDLYKSEIVNISNEVIRIIDRVHELSKQEEDIGSIEWPAYCQPPKPSDRPNGL